MDNCKKFCLAVFDDNEIQLAVDDGDIDPRTGYAVGEISRKQMAAAFQRSK